MELAWRSPALVEWSLTRAPRTSAAHPSQAQAKREPASSAELFGLQANPLNSVDMSTFPPTTSVFNDGYIAEMYESYRRDPSSVDESWRQYFRTAESIAGTTSAPQSDERLLRKVAAAASLAEAIREYGHLAVQLDPLGSPPPGAMELTPDFHGIKEHELADVPASALGYSVGTAADVVQRLRDVYCSSIALEFTHLGSEDEREWFRQNMEGGSVTHPLT